LSKIAPLEKLVQSQAEQISELSRKHEQAYEKVEDIANKAIFSVYCDIIFIPYGVKEKPSNSKDR